MVAGRRTTTIKLCLLTGAMSVSCGVHADTLSSEQYRAELDRIGANYKAAKARCVSLRGNRKDVCEKQAKGNEKVARAALEAQRKNTDRARREVAMVRIEAEYEVARERCDDERSGQKDVCLKSARTDYENARADARRDLTAANAQDGESGGR